MRTARQPASDTPAPAAAQGWKRLLRSPVTHAGLWFALVMFVVGVVAALSGNNLLFLIVAAMLSTLMISSFVSRLSLAGLELDFLLPEHIAARRRLTGRVFVRNVKRWVPSFSVHLEGASESMLTSLYFPVIPGKTTLEELVELCFERRGLYRESGFQFSTRFPFGFLDRHADVTLRREILVYPSIDPQPGFEEILAAVRGDLEAQVRGRGSDFYRIRPYEALESARHVDWKASAHTGELQVREFARERDRQIEIFLDLNVAPSQSAWFERAVDACAFLVWSFSHRDARIRFRTQEFDLAVPENGDVYAILRYLAMVTPRPGKAPLAPGAEDTLQLVLSTADTNRLADAGWAMGRIIGPAELA